MPVNGNELFDKLFESSASKTKTTGEDLDRDADLAGIMPRELQAAKDEGMIEELQQVIREHQYNVAALPRSRKTGKPRTCVRGRCSKPSVLYSPCTHQRGGVIFFVSRVVANFSSEWMSCTQKPAVKIVSQ